ncbi:protein kinase domain [Canna indica]|uniref:Protein kinase domain n=1 Tax=Canna indica TaxID=4628 RepID=A0AAQ3Q694_9LILI|nr:protein kinase domain [Canna indica]
MKFQLLLVILLHFRILGSQAQPFVCTLDCKKYSYKPVGECVNPDEHEVIVWENVRTTQCCRNGLNLFSRALANASAENQPLLLPQQQQWENCTSQFMNDFHSLSSCKFEQFRHDKSNCSSLSFGSINKTYDSKFHSIVANSCSEFYEASFVDICSNCTSEISSLIKDIVGDNVHTDDETEKAICSIATITAIASKKSANDTWTGDFYKCLAAMDSQNQSCKQKKNDVTIITLIILIGLMALALSIVLFKFIARKFLDDHKKDEAEKVVGKWSGLYRFSKAEIEKAISYSSSRVFLGAGSAGQVYKGVLPSGQLVAIKHIYETATNKTFTREVEGLSKVRHHNLVSLLGYCDENGDKFLVYEFCSNGNLAEILRGDDSLSWQKRIEILRDCSLALRFLHAHPDGCIIHRDIKLTNILLTEDMQPKLSDFGLARMVGMKETQCFTDVQGTIGYMDPEYMSNGNLTCASDIYSFGIVILQVLSGRKVIDLNTQARDTLTRAARDVIAGKRPLTDFVDPRIKEEVNLEDFKSILRVAVLCVSGSSKGRPRISDLIGEIDKACGSASKTKMPAQSGKRYASMEEYQSPEVIQV